MPEQLVSIVEEENDYQQPGNWVIKSNVTINQAQVIQARPVVSVQSPSLEKRG
jgi:hypothetical protein